MSNRSQHPIRRATRLIATLTLACAVSAVALLVPRPLAAQMTGRVTGVVTSDQGAPIVGAQVVVEGTTLGASTGADGRYSIGSVPAGTRVIRAQRIGFAPGAQTVTVSDGGTTTADFRLTTIATRLTSEIVVGYTTQTSRDVSDAVSAVTSEEIAAQAVATVEEALRGRVPGVQINASGEPGRPAQVFIRGQNFLSTSTPLYVVDGMYLRQNPNLNPDDIASIAVLKDASAAAQYGAQAANGVIVITTKRGRAGAARWSAFVEQGRVKDQNNYPSTYAILGHAPATPTTVRRCFLRDIGLGTCVMDSTTVNDIFDDPELTPIKNGWRNNLGVQLSGGTDMLRYFASGEHENEIGPFGMPQFEERRFNDAGIKILGDWRRPNALQKTSARANLSLAVSPKLDISMQSGFTKLDLRLPQVDNNVNSFWYNGLVGPGFQGAGPGYTPISSTGAPLRGYANFTPGDIFQFTTTQGVQRFIGSTNADWRPLSWLQARGDVGLDLADRVDQRLQRLAQGPDFSTQRQGGASDARTNIRNFTLNLAGIASWQAIPSIGFKTTVGAQYVNYQLDLAQATGSQLPPGATTPADGTIPGVGSSTVRQKTLGYFVEEAAAIRDRLFLTAAVRTDQNSAFGTNFQRVYYPKGSLSWLVSDESFFPRPEFLDQLRLRASIGASGVQPGPNDAARTFTTTTTNISNVDIAGLRSSQLGNANIKPERSTEFETGFEARLFNRVNFEATYYNKISRDALIDLTIAPSAGTASSNVKTNLGKVRNAGLEGLLNAQVLDRSYLGWDVTLNGSHNSNKLVTLGKDIAGKDIPAIIGNTIREVAGYPLYGYWQRPYTWSDANKDGIIVPSEVTVASDFQFMGYSQPRDEVSVTNGFEILGRKLRINAMFDYKGGYNLLNSEEQFLCQQSNSCPETSAWGVQTWKQARAVAQRFTSVLTQYGYIEPVQFWRFRELSATYSFDERFAQRYLRVSGGSITLGARNLQVWTKYTGVDPEANYSQGDTQSTLLTAGPPSYFTARLNLTF